MVQAADNAQMLNGVGEVVHNGIGRDIYMLADLFLDPASGRQHTDGKLRGGKIIGRIMDGDWVLYFALSRRETVSDIDDASEILGGQSGLMMDSNITPKGLLVFTEAPDAIVQPGRGYYAPGTFFSFPFASGSALSSSSRGRPNLPRKLFTGVPHLAINAATQRATEGAQRKTMNTLFFFVRRVSVDKFGIVTNDHASHLNKI